MKGRTEMELDKKNNYSRRPTMLTPKEADTLFDEEISYSPDNFSKSELKMMRMLARDRIENRFRMAMKAAEQMNLVQLKSVVDELVSLDGLALKISEVTENDN